MQLRHSRCRRYSSRGEIDTGADMAFQETSFRANKRTASTAIFGLTGGIVGFALSEPYRYFVDAWGTFSSIYIDIIVNIGFWFALILLGVGGALTASDSIINRDWQKAGFLLLRAAPFLVIGGIAAGFVAQIVYQNIVDFEAVTREFDRCFASGDTVCTSALTKQMPGRAIGWGVAGMLGGIPIGLAASSRTLTQNGAIGGAIGGLVGGAAFDPIGIFIVGGPDGLPRLVGIVLIGALIGVAFSAITAARTSVFLEVASGDYTGTQFPITDASMLVGCAANAAITLRGDREIKENHFTLSWDGTRLTYECVRNSPAIDVDGTMGTSGDIPIGSSITVGQTKLRALGSRSAVAAPPSSTTPGGAGPTGSSSTTAAPAARPNIDTRTSTSDTSSRGAAAQRPNPPTPPARPSIPIKKPNDPSR
jgi:hypothetical protein